MADRESKAKLTKKYVDGLGPEAKRYRVNDTEIPGFHVVVHPTGRKTYGWRAKAGGRGSKDVFVPLGVHGAVTVEQARLGAAAAWSSRPAAGALDVLGAKIDALGAQIESDRPKVAALTFGKVAAEFLLDARTRPRPLSQGTVDQYQDYLRLYLGPDDPKKAPGLNLLADTPLKDCTFARIKEVHAIIGSKRATNRKSVKEGPPITRTANKVLWFISSVLEFAEQREYLPTFSNPCVKIQKFPEEKPGAPLTEDELARLVLALDGLQAAQPTACDILRLILWTGRRYSEIQTLRWEHVDLENRVLTRPTKGKPISFLALDKASAAILARQERTSEWVFPGRTGEPSEAASQLWTKKLRALVRPGGRIRIHDLRHNLASHGLRSGLDKEIVGGLLGQDSIRSTEIYAKHAAEQLVAQADEAQAAVEAIARRGIEKLAARKG